VGNFDYKEFSLNNLRDVLGEVIDQDDCNPEEIAQSIIDACETNIDYHLKAVSKAAETIAKLKGLLSENKITEATPSDWDDFWSNVTPGS
jgi:hypothetical protein